MSRTLSEIGSEILKRVEIPEDSSTTQALADAKAYANERGRKIWRTLVLPEYLILGTYTVAASTRQIALSSIVIDSAYNTSGSGYNASFDKIIAIREGSNALMPEDAGAIQKLQPDLWVNTTAPVSYVPRGNQGIALLGYYNVSTALSFFGKAKFQVLTDSESWIVDSDGDALVEGAVADMLRYHERDENRASIAEQQYTIEINKLISERKVQGADTQRIVPLDPWTREFSRDADVSKIGINNYWE